MTRREEEILTLRDVTVQVNKRFILEGVNYDFNQGQLYALMGPNGSGKSSLAKTIVGYPEYKLSPNSKIYYHGQDISRLNLYQRSRLGLFLSYQSPPEFDGINIFELLTTALAGKKSRLTVKRQIEEASRLLGLSATILRRPLNLAASGGERKKIELIQAFVLEPDFLIFDEIDTGVDVDSLRLISRFIKDRFLDKNKTILLITHYKRILDYLTPNEVLVLNSGQLVNHGGSDLAQRIDERGYSWLVRLIKKNK